MEVPKQQRVRAPSTKMRRTAEMLMENPDASFGSAMRTAGYSEAQAKNPHQITRTKTWRQLIDEHLPEDKVAKVLSEQLEATNVYILNGKAKEKSDNQARLKAAEIVLRLRGSFAAEKHTNFYISLSELRRMRDSGVI